MTAETSLSLGDRETANLPVTMVAELELNSVKSTKPSPDTIEEVRKSLIYNKIRQILIHITQLNVWRSRLDHKLLVPIVKKWTNELKTRSVDRVPELSRGFQKLNPPG